MTDPRGSAGARPPGLCPSVHMPETCRPERRSGPGISRFDARARIRRRRRLGMGSANRTSPGSHVGAVRSLAPRSPIEAGLARTGPWSTDLRAVPEERDSFERAAAEPRGFPRCESCDARARIGSGGRHGLRPIDSCAWLKYAPSRITEDTRSGGASTGSRKPAMAPTATTSWIEPSARRPRAAGRSPP